MELFLKRNIKTDRSTIGELTIDGVHECYILEDIDRGLDSHMTPTEIAQKKIHGKTAIPTGKYEIALTFSNRFNRMMPLLLKVNGFEGVRIHWGNTDKDTEGCLLTGNSMSPNMVLNSKVAYNALFQKLSSALKKEKVFITIQ